MVGWMVLEVCSTTPLQCICQGFLEGLQHEPQLVIIIVSSLPIQYVIPFFIDWFFSSLEKLYKWDLYFKARCRLGHHEGAAKGHREWKGEGSRCKVKHIRVPSWSTDCDNRYFVGIWNPPPVLFLFDYPYTFFVFRSLSVPLSLVSEEILLLPWIPSASCDL